MTRARLRWRPSAAGGGRKAAACTARPGRSSSRRMRAGATGRACALWKWELQKFADDTGRALSVCHFPPGTSKWNKVEHRLFSFISSNWRGEPLRDYETIVHLIARTTTAKGPAGHLSSGPPKVCHRAANLGRGDEDHQSGTSGVSWGLELCHPTSASVQFVRLLIDTCLPGISGGGPAKRRRPAECVISRPPMDSPSRRVGDDAHTLVRRLGGRHGPSHTDRLRCRAGRAGSHSSASPQSARPSSWRSGDRSEDGAVGRGDGQRKPSRATFR